MPRKYRFLCDAFRPPCSNMTTSVSKSTRYSLAADKTAIIGIIGARRRAVTALPGDCEAGVQARPDAVLN